MQNTVQFEWDEAKNRANVAKHGIGFETAKRIFDGLAFIRPDRRKDYGEERYIGIGRVESAVIVVAYTERRGRLRLISARPASRKERQSYRDRTQETPDNR